MGTKTRFQLAAKQAKKRKKRRAKLTAKGVSPDTVFYGKFFIANKSAQSRLEIVILVMFVADKEDDLS